MTSPYEPGSVEKVLTLSGADRRRQGHRPHPAPRAGPAAERRPGHPRLVRPRHPEADPGRRDRPVVQHRHGEVVAALQPRPAAELPDRVRPRPAHRHRRQRRDPRPAAVDRRSGTACSRTGSPSARASRSTACRWRPRSTPSRTAASASSPSLIQGRATTNAGQVVGTDEATSHRVVSAERRPPDDADDGARRRPRRRVAPGGAGARLRRRRQDRHGAAGRRRRVAATTASSRSRSRASRRPTTRASPSTSWCRTPRTAAVAARSPARRSARSCRSRCAGTAYPPTGAQPSQIPTTW